MAGCVCPSNSLSGYYNVLYGMVTFDGFCARRAISPPDIRFSVQSAIHDKGTR